MVAADNPVFQEWYAQAQAPVPAYVRVVQEPPGQPYSAAVTGENTIHWAYDPAATESFSLSRPLFFHELGHVYDNTSLSNRKRNLIRHLFHWPTFAWFFEKFAQGYAYCASGQYPIEGYYGYSYHPWPWKHQRFCKLLWGWRR